MSDRYQIEQGGRDGQTRESDKYDSDDGVPHERYVAPQGCYHILAVHHGLVLPMRALFQGTVIVPAKNHPAHNFYVKLYVKCDVSSHGSHDRNLRGRLARPRGFEPLSPP